MEDSIAEDELRPVEVISLLYFLHLNINNRDNLVKSNLVREFAKNVSGFPHLPFQDIGMLRVVGSAAEGSISDSYTSDIDMLFCLNNTECCDDDCDDDHLNAKDELKAVYIADRRCTSPGYTRMINASKYQESLKCKRTDTSNATFLQLEDYASNSCFCLDPEKDSAIDSSGITLCGPALHIEILKIIQLPLIGDFTKNIPVILPRQLQDMEIDCTIAILFNSKSLQTSWAQRKRKHSWPSPELIQQIFELHGHVVPVGMKGSIFEQYEWRICYTLMENKLVCSLNEVQMVLYIELKKYAKRSDCLTSYMIKNIVLWMAECLPSDKFKSIFFIPLVRSALVVLQKCVERKLLPNYMIPSRNLFAGKLDDETERQELINFLSSSSGKEFIVPNPCHKLQHLLHSNRSGNTEGDFAENKKYLLASLHPVKGTEPYYMGALYKIFLLVKYTAALLGRDISF